MADLTDTADIVVLPLNDIHTDTADLTDTADIILVTLLISLT